MKTGSYRALSALGMRRDDVLAELRWLTATNVLRTDAEHAECKDREKVIRDAFRSRFVEDVYEMLGASDNGY